MLRALRREPESLAALLDEVALAGDAALSKTAEDAAAEADEASARHAVERLAVALQASLLVRHAPAAVAGAFRARTGTAYGTLPLGIDAAAIIERHLPVHA